MLSHIHSCRNIYKLITDKFFAYDLHFTSAFGAYLALCFVNDFLSFKIFKGILMSAVLFSFVSYNSYLVSFFNDLFFGSIFRLIEHCKLFRIALMSVVIICSLMPSSISAVTSPILILTQAVSSGTFITGTGMCSHISFRSLRR